MKRAFALLIAMLLIAVSAFSVGAADYGCDIATVSEAIYLKNLDTGVVVFEKNAEGKMYPASTTKVMTYIIVAENVPDFDNTRVEVTADMLADLDPESSVMGLEDHIGESFSVKDLLYGLMLPSGNDAALVLAEFVGHGVSSFVDLMNQKAAQLGCTNTHFTTPHGLYDPNHYSTAKDMAKITEYAMTKTAFNEITSAISYLPEGFIEPIRTTNYLIDPNGHYGSYYYEYAKGIKTGYTDEAGRCLISTAEKNGYHYLCVALGAVYSFVEDINYAMLDSRALYDWAFDKLSYQSVYTSTDSIKTVPVKYVWGNKTTELVPESEISALLPLGYDKSHITTSVECDDQVEAPVAKGDRFGTIKVFYDGELIGSTNVVASEDINRQFTNYLLHLISAFVANNLGLVIVIGLLVIFIIVAISVARRRRRIEREKRRYR